MNSRFLGQTFHKHGNKLHIIPSKERVLALIRKIGTIICKYVGAPLVIMIKKLNEVLKGWAYYHRYVVALEEFKRVNKYVFDQLWQMFRKRHPKKSGKLYANRYWCGTGNKSIFTISAKVKGKPKQ